MLTGNILETLTDDNKKPDTMAVRDSFTRTSGHRGEYLGDINFSEGNMIDLGIGRYHIANGEVEPWTN